MTDSSNAPSRPAPGTPGGDIPPRPPLPGAPGVPTGPDARAMPYGAPPAGYGTPPAGYGTPPAGYGQPGAPYAQAPAQGFGQWPQYGEQNAFNAQHPGDGFSGYAAAQSTVPPKSKKKWQMPLIAIVAGLAIAGASVGITLMLMSQPSPIGANEPSPSVTKTSTPSPEPSTAKPTPTKTPKPTPTATAKPTPQPTITTKPSPEPTASIPPQPGPDSGSADIPDRSGVTVSASTVRGHIESVLKEYDQLDASGELWKKIPDTEANTYAYLAFRYLVTDLKAATAFGVDNEAATEYWNKVIDYEKKLLTQKPLGTDVTIETKKTYFHYDGTTGEGEYKKR